MRVCISTVGCKVNQAEAEALARELRAAGHELVADPDAAELHVVNSCTVTAEAARDSRRLVRRGARAVVTGCWATREPEAARAAGAAEVVANRDKDRLAELLAAVPAGGEAARPAAEVAPARTRATVKAQDGCSMRCAFCVIPLARGSSRSRPADEVAADTAARVGEGYREVVLTGVQLSAYRAGGVGLAELVRRLLAVAGPARLRLSSVAPWDLDDELLGLWRDRRLCRHLHMSLQSGAAATLARMARPGSPAAYAAALAAARAAVPGVAVTTDVIVGFPGESDGEFAESLAFVGAMGFARVHVFPFSPRPGTAAATMPGQVAPPVVRARMAAMLQAARDADRAFRAAQVGREVEVLWEARRPDGWSGLTDTYLRVRGACAGARAGALTVVRVAGLTGDGLAA